MKILFVAPRFHTNQYQIVKSLVDKGHDVNIMAQFYGKSEDHSVIKPQLIKKSLLGKAIHKFLESRYDVNTVKNKKIQLFLPSLFDLFRQIKSFNPEVVILRNRNLTSLFSYMVCKIVGVKAVLVYNQTPLYTFESSKNNFKNFRKKLVREYLFPKIRITPVLTRNDQQSNEKIKRIDKYAYFVPFIANAEDVIKTRTYFSNNKINLLEVGKYRDYKNHFLLVDAVDLIQDKQDLSTTIVGQVTNEEEEKYFNELKKYINSKNLENYIHLRKNIRYQEMSNIYKQSDIFILTSKAEIASISVLEAMANGMPTISTDANGTASYIEEGHSGYLFKTKDAYDLALKLEKVIKDRNNIRNLGQTAFENIKNNYSFSNYYEALNEVLKKEFDVKLDVNDKG